MSRNTTILSTHVWRELADAHVSAPARILFVHLATTPDISLAGITPLAPARWAHLTGLAPAAIRSALDELVRGGWVLADVDTAEVLVHAFRRWNPLPYAYRRGDVIGGVISPTIRDHLSTRWRG